ncbi:hypothetical protein HMPREF0326_03028 [Desulfovibrio sp. 3_1_syn3]|uniref:hypothetical protein n=1 Tax=Desulfovibrio sp. 3_1_syn3 TaxID=457398 RepID=UPI0001E12D78|nr:hypothetical protein [Desulfovibrio sp. 3_1_syn3]EFL84335.1 hypothetical protein HMPREF0326_03028 [Desulfovibrio sp. 3_1_syn3]
MPDLVPLTFKADDDLNRYILQEMGHHDLNRSDFVRQCIRVAAPLLRECPTLISFDDKRIAEVMSKVGKIVVILDGI